MTKVCILGGTGLTGSAIIRKALNDGVEVLALVRNPNNLDLSDEKLTITRSEITEFESADVLQEISKCDHVVIALGSKKLWGDTIRSEGTKNILNALKKADHKPRIWCISAAGVGDSMSQLSLMNRMLIFTLLNRVINEHNLQEQIIIESGLPYTILRPTGLTSRPETGKYQF